MSTTSLSQRTPPPRLAFTLQEFCEATGLSRTAAYAAIAQGELRSFKNGKRRYIRAAAAEAWIAAREAEASGRPTSTAGWRL
jgi:excisionase family DNA binding protein